MKLLGLIVSLMIATSIAIPVNNPSDDVETVDVGYPEKNVEDTDTEPVYTSFLVPISISPYSFFDSVEDYFRNIRQRLLSRFLDVTDTRELDPAKSNSTSTVEVINGHRVEINNTVYVDKNENGEEVFKVRVLHIRPLDLDDSTTIASNSDLSGDDDEKAIKPKAEGTTAEPEFNNEIDSPKNPTTVIVVEREAVPIRDLIEEETSDVPTETIYKISKENIQPLYYETKADDDQNQNSNDEIELYQLGDSQTSTPIENLNEEESTNTVVANAPTIESIKKEFVNDDINDNEPNDDSDDNDGNVSELQEITNDNNVHLLDMIYAGEEIATDSEDTNENESNDENEKYNHRSRENFESSEEGQQNEYPYDEYKKFEQLNGEWFTSQEDYNNNDKDNNNNNNYDNEIDTYESIPIDLSNDINVNYIAEQNGATIDPDAEIFLQNNLNDYNVIKSLPLSENSFEGINNNDSNDDNDNDNDNDENISERKSPIK